MGRRPTSPIPEHLVEQFYGLVWDCASRCQFTHPLTGKDVDFGGWSNAMTLRRHAISVLWLTSCALRFSELRRLKAADVSQAGYSAYITRSKGGLSGQVEVAKALVAITFNWRSLDSRLLNSEWLIPSRTGKQLNNNGFNRDACGFFGELFPGVPLTSHCFRDTACQLAMSQAGQVRIVQRLMGHRRATTTEGYLAKQEANSFQLRLYEREYAPTDSGAVPEVV